MQISHKVFIISKKQAQIRIPQQKQHHMKYKICRQKWLNQPMCTIGVGMHAFRVKRLWSIPSKRLRGCRWPQNIIVYVRNEVAQASQISLPEILPTHTKRLHLGQHFSCRQKRKTTRLLLSNFKPKVYYAISVHFMTLITSGNYSTNSCINSHVTANDSRCHVVGIFVAKSLLWKITRFKPVFVFFVFCLS